MGTINGINPIYALEYLREENMLKERIDICLDTLRQNYNAI